MREQSSSLTLALAFMTGKAIHLLGGSRAALGYYDWCMRRWPSKQSLFLPEKAFVFERSNRLTEAIEYYLKALELDPENSLLNFNLACAHEAQGENALAVKYYEKTLDYGSDLDGQFLARVREKVQMLKARPN